MWDSAWRAPGRAGRYAPTHWLRTLQARECNYGNTHSRKEGTTLSAQLSLVSPNHGRPCESHKEGDTPVRRSSRISVLTRFVPVDNFSVSAYSVPMLLLFRMFYQAAPHEVLKISASSLSINQANPPTRPLPINSMGSLSRSRSPHGNYLDTYVKTNTTDFAMTLKDNDELEKFLILSITWVKALASPLSHEYIQFVVKSSDTGRRHRLVAERSDIGDLVTVGWDWSSGNYASHHHVLPLPLLTLSYEDLPADKLPTIQQFADILQQTSQIRPYNLMREMCWWYAEKVFVETSRKFPDARVKQWPFANLRYSFVVKSEWIRRPALADAAEQFRVMNVQELVY